jgi:hypothetical protein
MSASRSATSTIFLAAAVACLIILADPQLKVAPFIVTLLGSGLVIAWLGASLAVWLLFELEVGMTLTASGVLMMTMTSSAAVSSFVRRTRRTTRRTWVLWGDTTLVGALGRGLRDAGVSVVELTGHAATSEALADDKRFTDAQAVLCASTTMLQNVWAACGWSLVKREGACFRWATFEPPDLSDAAPVAHAGCAVWSSTVTALAVAEGLANGSHAIDVVEIGKEAEVGRFGESVQPLFWVDRGHARIIVDPRRPGAPRGDLLVVLRRRAHGYRVGRSGLTRRAPREVPGGRSPGPEVINPSLAPEIARSGRVNGCRAWRERER